MKYLLFYVLCIASFTGCSKDKTFSATASSDSDAGALLYKGFFYPTQWITANGKAGIYTAAGTVLLQLDSFSVSTGPDLKVYLSKKESPTDFINLGPLKNNTGKQRYNVPAGTDFTLYRYVLIHCQQYNHLFAIAELKP